MPTDWLRLTQAGALPIWSPAAMLIAKVTIILLFAFVLTRSMRRAPAGSRHLVWLVTLGAILVAPALAAWSPLPLRLLPPPATATQSAGPDAALSAPLGATTAPLLDRASPIAPSLDPGSNAPAPAPASSVNAITRWATKWGPTAGVALWAVVALLILARLARSSVAVSRIVNRSIVLDGASWHTPLVEVADRVGLDEVPRLLVSPECTMPFACGLITPTIVLPHDCHSWSADRRRAVLLHELAHVRRGDLIGHLLGRLVCAVYWFHPLAWVAAKRLRSESERACDDLAVACGTRAADYAEHLLDIVTAIRPTPTPAVALAMARRQEFEGRLLAILDPSLGHAAPSRRQSAVLIGALALSATLVAAVAPASRSPRAVSPSPTVRTPPGQTVSAAATQTAPQLAVRQAAAANARHTEPPARRAAASTAAATAPGAAATTRSRSAGERVAGADGH